MQLGFDVQIPDGLLAANALLAENSRQGFATGNRAPYQGLNRANCTAALGLSWSVASATCSTHLMGRWMSPDWSAKEDPVPYAKLDNPQSLNLYGYVLNNPLSTADPDGHCPWCPALEQVLTEVEESPAGQAVNRALGAAGGAALGYIATHASEIGNAYVNSVANGGGATTAVYVGPIMNQGSKPEIVIDGDKHPESAQHAADAQAAGHPADVTIDRGGAAGRRADALSGTPAVPGAHRDEYPPASTTQGGTGASVRPIKPSDNSGAGASMGNQMRPHPDGTTVTIKPINVPKPPTP